MRIADGGFGAFAQYVRRASIFLLALAIPAMTGCTGFFIPVCQANSNCPTSSTGTGASPGTGTGSGTSTNGYMRSAHLALGGKGASVSAHAFVYVSDARSESIQGYAIAAGRLRPALAPLYTAGETTTAIALDRKENRLFRLTAEGGVYMARIDRSGGLQPTNSGRRVGKISNAKVIAVDRTGKYLFVAAAHPSSLIVLRTDTERGILTRSDRAASTADAGSPRQILVDPKNQWVVVPLGSGGFDFFRFDDRTGTLGSALRVSPLQPKISKDIAATADTGSRFLYVSETGEGIRIFRIGAAGLTEASASPLRLSGTFALSPTSLMATGRMLFAAYPSRKYIAEYNFGASGGLKRVGAIQYPVASSVGSLTADPAGNYLLGLSNTGSESLISSYDARSGEWLQLP